jgi:hypothetical protein
MNTIKHVVILSSLLVPTIFSYQLDDMTFEKSQETMGILPGGLLNKIQNLKRIQSK